jgi:hypothetical protein
LDDSTLPLLENDPDRMPLNSVLPPPGHDAAILKRRVGVDGQTQKKTLPRQAAKHSVADQRALNRRRLPECLQVRSLEAFDLSQERRRAFAMRMAEQKYGARVVCFSTPLDRRRGFTFVQVTHGNWDTHRNNYRRAKGTCPMSSIPVSRPLIRDLKERGRLWMKSLPHLDG